MLQAIRTTSAYRIIAWPVASTIDLILPPECVWCSASLASGELTCSTCHKILAHRYYACRRCACPLPEVVPNESCPRCHDEKWRFSRTLALGPYRGRMREAVILMKKPQFESLAMVGGKILGEKVLQELADAIPDFVIPVPNHWTRRIIHRTSSAEVLAQAVSRQADIRLKLYAVRRRRITSKQGMLNWSARRKNVRGAFAIRSGKWMEGKHILLVDDVMTSGATVAEISKLLRSAGATRVSVAVVARGTGTSQN